MSVSVASLLTDSIHPLVWCVLLGDELRATGNLAGMAAGALLGTVGRGLGGGVSGVTRTLGNGIEDVTGLVGARRLGAGVNLVVSGAGDGIGNTLTGGKIHSDVLMDA